MVASLFLRFYVDSSHHARVVVSFRIYVVVCLDFARFTSRTAARMRDRQYDWREKRQWSLRFEAH